MIRGVRRYGLVAGAALAALAPLVFAGAFAGDAQVHLVFAENAAHGRWFEFNRGQFVSGETSPGYMLLGAAMFRVFPSAAVPVVLKIVGLLAWYALAWLVYRTARRLLSADASADATGWAAAAACVASLIAGSAYNANVGMENGLFAAGVWLWIDRAAAWRWFERPQPAERLAPSPGRELLLGLLLGACCWLRPEGWLIMAVAWAVRFRSVRPSINAWLVGMLPGLLTAAAALVLQWLCTGDLISTSILSRRLLSHQQSLQLGPVTVDLAFTKRLAFLLPVTGSFAAELRSGSLLRTALGRFWVWLLLVFFVLYTFVTGAAQLSRYVIFLMPILAIGAVCAARRHWQAGRLRPLVVLAAACFLVTNAGELAYRCRAYSQKLLSVAIAAPANRAEATDLLLRDLGAPTRWPVVIALEPIQVRYQLDDRVIVRSVDGRVDRALLRHVQRGRVDFIGYLRDAGVNYVSLPAQHPGDSEAADLTQLRALRVGQRVAIQGLTFARLPSGFLSIVRQPN